MTKASYRLVLPTSVNTATIWLANEDGVSLNQWFTDAIVQTIGVSETAANLLKQRAGSANPTDMFTFLDGAGCEAPPVRELP